MDCVSFFEQQVPIQEIDALRVPAVYGIGLNYRSFAKAMGLDLPTYPLVFSKPLTAIRKGNSVIELPRGLRSDKVDYEGELAVVIGRTCKNVTREQALDFVAGYTIAVDVTARDWQFEWGNGQFVKGKSFDGFCPIGPKLVSRDVFGDDFERDLETRLNGTVVQQGRLSDLIFPVAELIAFLSGSTTLLPGTVILTGTPAGSGHQGNPKRYLQDGDQLEVKISGIGELHCRVQEEVVGV